jgi:hypothetical protein
MVYTITMPTVSGLYDTTKHANDKPIDPFDTDHIDYWRLVVATSCIRAANLRKFETVVQVPVAVVNAIATELNLNGVRSRVEMIKNRPAGGFLNECYLVISWKNPEYSIGNLGHTTVLVGNKEWMIWDYYHIVPDIGGTRDGAATYYTHIQALKYLQAGDFLKGFRMPTMADWNELFGMMSGDANTDPLRKVLRFPFNGMKLMDDGVHQAQDKGQRSYYWSADPGDAQDSFNVAVISPTGCGYTEEAEPGTRCAVRFVRERSETC